jgi:triacylglycerol lipase
MANIVLAHGFLGFRKIFGIEYFNGLKAYLEANLPVSVLVTEVDPDNGIEVRGEELRRQFLAALGELPPSTEEERRVANTLDARQKTHLLAHSMGGLDSRFMLSPANPSHVAARVASLTTIATPHRGSPIANVIAAKLGRNGFSLFKKFEKKRFRKMIEHLGISLDGLHDLTMEACERFNQKYIDHPNVRYFSIAGQGRAEGRPTAKLLYPTYKYIKKKTGESNDGLVTVASARWGEFDSNLWPADHADMVGHDLDRIRQPGKFDHFAEYRELVERLLHL